MSQAWICFTLMLAGAVLAGTVLFRQRRNRKLVQASLITGVAVALANMAVEAVAARFDLYYVSGPGMVFRTPLPLTLAWVFLTFVYCTLYGRMIRGRQGKAAATLYMAGGIIAGALTDYLFSRLGVLTLGAHGSPAFILAVWLLFIPGSIFLYELLLSSE